MPKSKIAKEEANLAPHRALVDAYIRLLERANRLHKVIDMSPFDGMNENFGSASFTCRVRNPKTNELTTLRPHFLSDSTSGLRIRTGRQIHDLGHDKNGSLMKELDRIFPDDADRFAQAIIGEQSFAARANVDPAKKSTDVSRRQ